MTARDWKTAAKALAVLSVLTLAGGLALGASWQRAAQAHSTKTGLEYVNVDGHDYFPDERTREDAQPTSYTPSADWTVAPCAGMPHPVPAYTIPTFCVDNSGHVVPVTK